MDIAIVGLVLALCIAVCAGISFSLQRDVKLYRFLCEDAIERAENLVKQNISLTTENGKLKIENNNLKDQLYIKSLYKKDTKPNASKEVIDAVKYAMKAAHPDNGGKQEDFIKFNSLYNKIR